MSWKSRRQDGATREERAEKQMSSRGLIPFSLLRMGTVQKINYKMIALPRPLVNIRKVFIHFKSRRHCTAKLEMKDRGLPKVTITRSSIGTLHHSYL